MNCGFAEFEMVEEIRLACGPKDGYVMSFPGSIEGSQLNYKVGKGAKIKGNIIEGGVILHQETYMWLGDYDDDGRRVFVWIMNA